MVRLQEVSEKHERPPNRIVGIEDARERDRGEYHRKSCLSGGGRIRLGRGYHDEYDRGDAGVVCSAISD